jgi:hypothetical protein
MATIDKLDISIYNYYAQRTQMIEQLKQNMRIDQDASIPAQLQILDIYPRAGELDLLLGNVPFYTPWAYFAAPKRFNSIRRSPFAFYRVAPSLQKFEEDDEEEGHLKNYPCETEEEEKEKQTIIGAFAVIKKINGWVRHIVGQMGRFVQG